MAGKSLDTTKIMYQGVGAAAAVVAIGFVNKTLNDQKLFMKEVTGANNVKTMQPDRMLRGGIMFAAGIALPMFVTLKKGASMDIVESVSNGFMLAGADLLLREFAPDLTQGGLSAIGGVENIYDPSAYINAARNAVQDYINCNCSPKEDTVQILDENGNQIFVDAATGEPMIYEFDVKNQVPALDMVDDCEKYLQR